MNSKLAKLCLLACLFVSDIASGQAVWDTHQLAQVKQSIDEPFYATAFQHIKVKADSLLDAEPLSVMMKDKVPASGDMHDYMSQARYTWPDPTKPDGLPYIRRDGETNPEINRLDRNRLGLTAERVTTLALSWYFSGDEKYAQKATELIRTWFLDKETCMNPNLNYSQMVPGRDGGKGRSYGLIDTYSFLQMLDGVALLESSKSFTDKDSKALKSWFAKLTDWMINSDLGKEEAANHNNHSVAYDAQVIGFAIYTGNKKLATSLIDSFSEKRIFPQVEPDGSQPLELQRTLAYHYSWYNLHHFIDVMLMARSTGIDIANITSPDGRNFYKALDFMLPYTGQGRDNWPYQQISGWDLAEQNLCKDFYRAAMYLDPSRKDYLKAYYDNRVLNYDDIFNLAYVKASDVDNAFAFAERQLNYAIDCANEARKEKTNAEKRRVIPRTINADGTLSVVAPRDWCSGFFGGSLWNMYAFTNNDYWRQQAISWTWPIEESKWCKETHDLGFIMYCSFGKALELTGEKSYKDVVVQSAKSLISRYNPAVKAIRSWDHHADVWRYPVIIDNMMNLEMLFRATEITGDSIYWNVAVNHANTTLKNHFRDNYSSYHVVSYNPETGEPEQKCTHQGFADDSYWSRGQGWGLYGYAMCYRFTKDPKYLAQSQHIADFVLGLPNMPADGVPYWDMNMASVNGRTPDNVNPDVPRDASAASLIASGLYELSTYVDAKSSAKYRTAADKILDSLNKYYRADPETAYGFLLLHSVGNWPAGVEIDAPLNYADYYYLEALWRKNALDNRKSEDKPVAGEISQYIPR